MRFWSLFLGLYVIAMLTSCEHSNGRMAPSSSEREYTLAIIKPNAVLNNDIGGVLARLETGGLRIAALKMQKLTLAEAQKFYAVHKGRAFYPQLTEFMSSGPIVAVALEGEHAVQRSREIMGETDPTKATRGTIRSDYGLNITENAIHGSDSVENAKKELAFFFKPGDLQQRF
jgi:nucleoside-diphosphate kinase